MIIKLDKVYLIVSKDEKLIAKGVPRDRYICHVDEGDNKRILTYTTKSKATSAYKDCGFFVSDAAETYVKLNYPNLGGLHVYWQNISHLFEAREFSITIEST